MPTEKTEITEIVTGLGMLGYQDLQRALEVRPRHIVHVTEEVFERLETAWSAGRYRTEFTVAWDNGAAFARSNEGLRGRPPWHLEWKGHHRPASKGIETIPADLRVDHVYLVSCKYGSTILHNSRPSALFVDGLRPGGDTSRRDWFEGVAPRSYRALWEPVRSGCGFDALQQPGGTTVADRSRVRAWLEEHPVDDHLYGSFVTEVSEASARAWQTLVHDQRGRQEMLWRLLRFQAAPYFVLGARKDGRPLRYRVATPWDFQRHHRVSGFRVTAGRRGQPSVDWSATVTSDPGTGSPDGGYPRETEVSGFVEIRWSHGKFQGVPEAKVHLDTDPNRVPGYHPL